jgi:hypothetical protein
MDTDAQIKKPGRWKRVFFIVLILLPIVLFLEATLGTMMSSGAIGFFVQNQLLEERNQAARLTSNVLIDHLTETGHELWLFQLRGMAPDEITFLVKEYPELFGVYLLGKDRKTTSLLQEFPSAGIQERIISLIPAVVDSVTFFTASWDTTWKRGLLWREVEKHPYSFGCFQSDGGTYVVVMDIERLKAQMPAILDQWQRRLISFGDYFLPFPEFAAQVKFYDINGDNFYTLGNPKGTGWDQILDQRLSYLPWKMTVQIFPQDKLLISIASMAGRMPWQPVIPLIIGVICILVLAWTARKSWWY